MRMWWWSSHPTKNGKRQKIHRKEKLRLLSLKLSHLLKRKSRPKQKKEVCAFFLDPEQQYCKGPYLVCKKRSAQVRVAKVVKEISAAPRLYDCGTECNTENFPEMGE